MTALQFGIALLVNSANDSNFRSFLVDQANHVRHFMTVLGIWRGLHGSLITGVGRSSGIEFQRRKLQSYRGGWVRQGVCAQNYEPI
jgi:hypothetical protein